MNVVNIDFVTPVLMLAALRCKVARAEAEIETHRGRFENTCALLKLVKDTRSSPTASLNREIFQAWEGWIDGRIIDAERVLADLKDVVQRKAEAEHGYRSFAEKISWVMKYKDVAENLGLRLDQCHASLLAILNILVLAHGRQQQSTCLSESGPLVVSSGVWPGDNIIPCIHFSNFGLACSDSNQPRLLPSNSPCLSRSPTDLSSVVSSSEPFDIGRRIEDEEGQDIELYTWLREKAKRDFLDAEEEELYA